jgi:peptidoglycan/LPS O-acetylase OafA/YrhL
MTSILIAGFFAVLFDWLLRQGNFHYMTNLRLVIEGFFGAGCIACLLRRYVPVSTGLMAVVAIACLIARKTGYETPFTWLAVGYFVLWFSYVPKLPKIPHDLDLSYGTYLWAWPIQQTLVGFGVRDPVWLILSATPIVLTIAAASWLLIEKPALRLKDLRRQRAPALQPA